jgi:hypothetical protein
MNPEPAYRPPTIPYIFDTSGDLLYKRIIIFPRRMGLIGTSVRRKK